MDIDADVLTAAQQRLGTTNTRSTITTAVTTYLPQLVSGLRELGVISKPTGRRKPRSVDNSAWDALTAAENEVALDVVAILRACLTLAGRQPGDPGPQQSESPGT